MKLELLKEQAFNILNGNLISKYISSEKQFELQFTALYEYINKINIFNLSFKSKLYMFVNNIKLIPICKTCNKELKYKNSIIGFGEYCSNKCSNNDPLIKEKNRNGVIKTFQNKYGVNSPSQVKEIRDKQKNTCFKNNGNEITFLSKSIKEKIENTNKIRYGNKNYFNTDDVKIKRANTFKLKYNNEIATKNIDIIKKIKDTKKEKNKIDTILMFKKHGYIVNYYDDDFGIINCKCKVCNSNFVINKGLFHNRKKINDIFVCTNCYPINEQTSFNQIEITNFIKEYIDNIEINNNTILYDKETNRHKHMDIYLPDYKIGIEYNGFAYHHINNEIYHLNKTLLAKENNIQLLHIYQDDWNYKKDIIKSILLNKIGKTKYKIYGRKCIIKEVNNKDSKLFLINNHLQGNRNAKINLGLYYNDELVSLMTFGKSSDNKGFYEMYRFCNKLNTNIIGGASKLFKYFLNNYEYDGDLITQADYSFSNGNLYKQLGFKFIKLTEPSFWYIKNGFRFDRRNFQKHKLVEMGFDNNLTAEQIMINEGYDKLYNSGNLKFIYQKIIIKNIF